MEQIIGAFYFKQNKSGNLLGEFTNNKMEGVSTESSDLTSNYKMKFEGIYETTWFEENIGQNLTLEIRNESKNDNLFELTWRNKKGDMQFRGVGFIVGKKLIGYYTDDKKTCGNTV